MTSERWKQIEQLFHAALERKPRERASFLSTACHEDESLISEVQQLLSHHDNAREFIEPPPEAIVTEVSHQSTSGLGIGNQIGSFRLVRKLASGGMGTVFEATQDHPKRTVALKILRTGYASPTALRRFEHESHVLAYLKHPAIAQVYETGVFDDGGEQLPYFAMEHIPGAETIIQYANAAKLGVRERLSLFADVCDAVHHGHQRGIIHRDLKPGNILVDASGRPKVIDFGVARVTDSDLLVTTMHTDVGQLVGTLAYMSPEQCAADLHELDTRSDVYSLGVVLFELLCSRLPYDVKSKPIVEAAQIIQHKTPIRPSSERLQLKDDIETIILKALEKEPERRYQSAADLGADIRRFLDHRPIEAQPPSFSYQLRLFTRRNRALVTAGIVVFIVLFASVGVITALAIRADQAAQSAVQAARSEAHLRVEAELITRFLQEMLASANPRAAGKETTVLALLDDAAGRIEKEFQDHASVGAALHHTIGVTYESLGLFDQAEHHLRNALGLARSFMDEDCPLVAEARTSLGKVLVEKADYTEAESLISEAISVQRQLHGEERAALAISITALAKCLADQGDLDTAERHYREALAIQSEIRGGSDAFVARATAEVAGCFVKQGKDDEAESMYRRALAINREYGGEDNLDRGEFMHNLAGLMIERGDHEEAESLIRKSLVILRKYRGDEHPLAATGLNTLSVILLRKGNREEAESALRECLAINRERLGPNHPTVGRYLLNLGHMLKEKGDYEEAESLYREALSIQQQVLGAGHADVAFTFLRLATLAQLRGNHESSESLIRQALDIRIQRLGENHPHVAIAMNALGLALVEQRKYEEAETVLQDAMEKARRYFGEQNWLTAVCESNIGMIRRAEGEFEEAERIYRKVLKVAEQTFGYNHVHTARSQHNLALTLRQQEKLDEAESLFRETLRIYRVKLPEHHLSLAPPLMHLGSLLTSKGHPAEGESLLRESIRIQSSTLPEGHWRIAYARTILGRCLTEQGRYDEADSVPIDWLATLRAELGEDAKETKKAKKYLDRLAEVRVR